MHFSKGMMGLYLMLAMVNGYASPNPYYGLQFSTSLASKEPPNLRAYQLYFSYFPNMSWRKFNFYFDLGLSYLTLRNNKPYPSLYILSLAPVARYTFITQTYLNPYIELSIGPSYLSKTRIENRNLGIHFSFQDRIGIGTRIGNSLSVGLHAVHYSNACLSKHNSGITIPLVLDVQYRFQ